MRDSEILRKNTNIFAKMLHILKSVNKNCTIMEDIKFAIILLYKRFSYTPVVEFYNSKEEVLINIKPVESANISNVQRCQLQKKLKS